VADLRVLSASLLVGDADHHVVPEGLAFDDVEVQIPVTAEDLAHLGGAHDSLSWEEPICQSMVVADIEHAHAQLRARGVEVSPIDVKPWGSFVFFTDPDGNKWALQQLPPR
jgi:hypothetical protein